MSRLSLPLRAYIATVSLVAVAMLVGLAITASRQVELRDLYYMAVLGGLVSMAGRVPLHITPKTKLVVQTAPAFAAVLLLPPAFAVATCVTGKVIGQSLTKAPMFQRVFNIATTTVSTSVAAIAASVLREGSLTATLENHVWVLAGVGVVLAAGNVVLIEGIISIQLRRRPFFHWWAMHQPEVQHEVVLLLLGLFAAVVADLQPIALLLIIAPTAIVYRSLRDGLQLQVQTRETVEALADIVDMRDHYTFEHSKRVANMARELALAMKLEHEEAEAIYLAARVHDVGKIGIKGQILLKEGKLTDEEWGEMRTHPELGAKLVGRLPEFHRGLDMILSHHERYDGKGYPRALKGEEIPLGARVISVVDTFDAMTSHRSYRRALDPDYVFNEFRRIRGTQLDPSIVDVFLEILAAKGDAAFPFLHEEHDHGHAHEHDHEEEAEERANLAATAA